MDRLPVKGAIGIAVDRSCAKCHQSWTLQPSNKDVKEGTIDGRLYCLDGRACIKMPDGVYPLLAFTARERPDLCSSKGKWFTPTREVPLGPIVTEETVKRTERFIRRATGPIRRLREEADRAKPAYVQTTRKPYKVS